MKVVAMWRGRCLLSARRFSSSTSATARHFDVSIVGGGPTGGALACALAAAAPHLSVAVIDLQPLAAKHELPEHPDLRVLALSPSSKTLLERMGVWEAVDESGRVAPFYDMHVWDAQGPGSLSWSASEAGTERLGYVVENALLTDAVYDKLASLDNVTVLAPDQLESVEQQSDAADPSPLSFQLKHAGGVTSSLLVGSDGANSHARRLMGITRRTGWRYRQKAVVCAVQFEEGQFSSSAYQRFLPSGPLALLPCHDNYGSVVWSTSPGHADALVAMEPALFEAELRRHLTAPRSSAGAPGPDVPHVERLVGNRACFPLQVAQSYPYVRPRFALVGDAAHSVHPLAGQGFNLALADVAVLVERIEQAVRNGEDVGSHAVLQDYQKRRLLDNSFSLAGIDAVQKIFSVQSAPFAYARGLGMMAIDKLPVLKNLLARKAMGQ